VATVAYGSLPFKEQIEFFRRKRSVLTDSYLDVWESEHDHAFMVAGANQVDLLADFREAIDKTIAEGRTLEQFRADFDAIVARYGWDYNGGRNWRSRVIYETNLRQSYNAGRWDQLQRLVKVMPYWRYRHSDSVQHPRPLHLSWNNLTLRANDPWFNTHWAANGYGCQCWIEGVSERDLKRMGKNGPDTAPAVNMVQVVVGQRSPGGPQVVLTPEGVDPGFGYAPGRSSWSVRRGGPQTPPSLQRGLETAAQDALASTARLPAAPAAAAADRILGVTRALDALDGGYAAWLQAVVTTGQPRNGTYLVGAMSRDVVDALTAAGNEPATAAIALRDAEALHALRDAKQAASRPIAWTADELARLPSLLRKPTAVLLDLANGTLRYVVDASTRRGAGKVIVAVNYRLKMDSGREVINSVRTASLIDLEDLRADLRGGRLQLISGSLE